MSEKESVETIEKTVENPDENNDSESLDNFSPEENVEEQVPVKTKKTFKINSPVFVLMMVFFTAMIISLSIFQVWLTPIKVVGVSMQPTINKSVINYDDDIHTDVVYFSKEKSYNNNDIVIIKNNDLKYVDDTNVEYLIKRVIACPGEWIEFKITHIDDTNRLNKKYYYEVDVLDKDKNSINLDQSYLDKEMYFTYSQYLSHTSTESKNYFYYKIFTPLLETGKASCEVEENSYFVMGDNRNESMDSRFFGVIDYDDISGSVKLIIAYGQNIFSAIWYKLKNNY